LCVGSGQRRSSRSSQKRTRTGHPYPATRRS
jgi:hypothetical protein